MTKSDDEARKAPWYIRRRVGMAPLWAGLVAALAAWASFQITPQQTLVAVLGPCAFGFWLANLRWGRKELGVRNFAWIIMGAAGSFVLVVRNQVWPLWAVGVALAVCVIGLGIFWWTDPWNKKRVKVERDQERWPILAKKISMAKVNRTPVMTTETGRKWRFYWDAGDYTLQAFRSNLRALEGAHDIPEGFGRIEYVYDKPGQKTPNSAWLVENTQSANNDAPVDFGEPTMKRFTDPMYIGPYEDQIKHEVRWYDESFGGMHTLAAGATGSGKSGLYHLVQAESAYCPDVVRWGIDAKGGMALKPWASLYDWFIDDADDSLPMLRAIGQVLIDRSKYAASRGWDVWQPSAEHPVLLLVVDEAAEILGLDSFDANDLMASIARMGRAAGVLMLLATQHPNNDALGSTQLTKNVRRRFCFSVEDMAGQTMIIPKSANKIDATEIPIGKEFAGTYYCSDGGVLKEKRARVRYVTRFDIYRLVLAVGYDADKSVSDLDELSQAAAIRGSAPDPDEDGYVGKSAYEEREIYTVEDTRPPKGWDLWVPDGWVKDPETQEWNKPTVEGENSPPWEVQGDEAFDDEVLDGERTPVQGRAGAPSAPVHGASAGQDTGVQPDDEKETAMDLDQIATPQTPAEVAALDQALAEFAHEYGTRDLSPGQAQEALDRLLAQAPEEGITIEAMRKLLGRGSTWYGDQLRARIQDGRARKLSTGRYVGTHKLVLVGGSAGEE